MQAILTKFINQTETKPARIKAVVQGCSVTLPWDPIYNLEANHHRAAAALARKLMWLSEGTKLTGGHLPPYGRTFAFLVVKK